jgi:hypothetical protein
LLGNRKKIAKFLMRTSTCRSTFLYLTVYYWVLSLWLSLCISFHRWGVNKSPQQCLLFKTVASHRIPPHIISRSNIISRLFCFTAWNHLFAFPWRALGRTDKAEWVNDLPFKKEKSGKMASLRFIEVLKIGPAFTKYSARFLYFNLAKQLFSLNVSCPKQIIQIFFRLVSCLQQTLAQVCPSRVLSKPNLPPPVFSLVAYPNQTICLRASHLMAHPSPTLPQVCPPHVFYKSNPTKWSSRLMSYPSWTLPHVCLPCVSSKPNTAAGLHLLCLIQAEPCHWSS